MKFLQFTMLYLIVLTPIYLDLLAQEIPDHLPVSRIYEALQDKSKSSREIAALMPELKWDELKIPENVDPRYTITLGAILKNHWGSLLFEDLGFSTLAKNKVLVTGVVSGRRTASCDFITVPFKHTWILKEGNIVQFIE